MYNNTLIIYIWNINNHCRYKETQRAQHQSLWHLGLGLDRLHGVETLRLRQAGPLPAKGPRWSQRHGEHWSFIILMNQTNSGLPLTIYCDVYQHTLTIY